MSGWNGSHRRAELPPDWDVRRERTRRRAQGRCEADSQVTEELRTFEEGTRCVREGTDCDHRTDRWDHDDLQWLCRWHHQLKTIEESRAARARLGPVRRPLERHPGRLR